MGMTGKELLEKYKKRRQGNDVSSEETTKTTETNSSSRSGSELLESYRKSRGLTTSTEETTEEESKDERDGWFQKSDVFDDGYQFGDVTKTVVGSATDIVTNLGAGLFGIGEKALDAFVTISPYFAQGQYYANGGGYNLQADRAFDQSIEASKEWASDFVQKDLYDEETAAKVVFADSVNALTGINAETDSVFGEKTDSLGQSAGQLIGTAALQWVGVPWWLTTGATTLGSESENALYQGATLEEATLSGLVSAGAEILTEKISGGISFGGKTLDDVLPKLTSSISNKVVRKLADLGIDMVGEGTEEVLSGVMSAIGQKLTYASDSELSELFSSEDALDSFIGGAVLSGVGGIVRNGVKTIYSNKQASKLYGNQSQQIIDDALSVQNNSELHNLAEQYKGRVDEGKNLRGGQINRLIEATDTAKLKNSILQRLGELGETGDVTPIADALVKQAVGDELTLKEKQLLNDNNNAHIIAAEMNPKNIKSGGLGNKWAESIGTRRISPESYNKELYDFAKQMAGVREAEEKDSVAKTIAESETATGTKFEASESGKTTYTDAKGNTRDVSVKGIASTKGGLKVELEGGITVNATDLSFGSREEALMYEMVARMEVTPETANEIISTFKPSNIQQATRYFSTVPLAHQYGTMNYEAGLKNIALPKNLKRIAFNRGRMDAIAQDKANTKPTSKKGSTKTTTNKNGIIFENGYVYDEATADEIQKKSMPGIEFIDRISHLEVHVYESKMENGERVAYVNGMRVTANGFFTDGNKIYIDINAGSRGEGAMLYTMSHEVTHYIREWNAKGFREIGDFLLEEFGKKGVPVNVLLEEQKDKIRKRYEREVKPLPSDGELADKAYEELVADAMSDMLTDPKAYEKLAKFKRKNHEGWKKLGEAIKALLDKIKTALGIYKTEMDKFTVAQEAHEVRRFSADVYEKLQDLYIKAFVEADANYEAAAEKHLKNRDIAYNLRATESHKAKLEEQYSEDANIDLDTLMKRYDKIIGIWKSLGGELDSKFLNEWNNKVGKDRAFTVFKAQAGYKYNVELSSMCKKGVPLFEAIDTIVKNEVMKELNTKVLGKAEKEILYDLLKSKDFEIPCAICYVEQARQREGVIIDAFLNGKIEKNASGKVTTFKLGWNEVLKAVEKEMKALGVDYSFTAVDRSIATDKYSPADISMDEATQDAFYKALKKIANKEITRYNKEEKKNRKLVTNVTPSAIKEVFKGTLPSNLKIFKVLFNDPSSRFTLESDLLYSSMTTHNLATAHNDLYSLFNSQGGVSGYKTKQGTVVYWGDILGKTWTPSKVRDEGGIRNQSNSDFQMYTLLDQVQMYIDFSAKGYYLQAYTKVLSELKLFGLSRGKINASLIPAVYEYRNADGTVDIETTRANAGLDKNGNLLFDDIEGINHREAFMLLEDAEYSKSIGGICIGYSDAHILKLLDDSRVQQIIGFHDKTDDPDKRYRGARYAKNYNGLNEAVQIDKDGKPKTIHIGFNPYVRKAEKKFTFNSKTETYEGTVIFNGKTYVADDIPKLAADMYLDMCEEKGYAPAYEDFAFHENYYKLLADFSLYDSQGHYAPHRKVAYNMPDSVPYLDINGKKQYMPTKDYIKTELEKELKVRDAISEELADKSENGLIPQFVKKVNELHSETKFSDRDTLGNELSAEQQEFFKDSKVRDKKGNLMVLYHGTTAAFNTFKRGDVGFHFGTKGAARGRVGYGKNTILKEVYLNITNPIVFNEDLGSWDADYRLTRELYDMGILTQEDAESVLFTDDRQYRRTTEKANKKLAEVLLSKGYDGIAYENTFEGKKTSTSYIVFNSNQAKEITNKTPTSNPDIRYSDRDPYSYETLTSKPDIKITTLDGVVPNNRADVVVQAKKNAASVGKTNKDGSVSVHVDDIGADVILSTKGLRHGLRRVTNTANEANYIVTLQAGEILKHSIRINELTPSDKNANGSYVLIGAAEGSGGELYIVRSIINQFNNELASMDVLYAVNAKKESAALNAPRLTAKPLSVTDSFIMIAQLLDFVNRHFPDILPESVLRHYGYDARPDGKIGEDALYSDRDPNAVSNRTLLANALESVAQNDIEKNKLTQYKNKIALIESEQKKLNEIRAKANEIRFTKGRTPAETKTMHDLDAEATQIANRISTWDKQLLNLESTTAIKNVLEREKAMLRKKLEQKSKQALKDQRQKDAATTRELLTRYQESRTKAIESRHKTEMRHKIKNVVSDLNKLLLNPTKDQHVPIGLQLPVAEALDAINMDTMNAGERVAYYNDLISKSNNPDEIAMLTKKRDFFEYRDANFKERITALKNAYAEFKESDDPLIRNAHNDAIEDLIKNTADAVGNKSLKDMSMAQLEAVYNMYKAILATVRNSNKKFIGDRQETITENSERVKTEVKEVGGHKERVLKLAKFFKKFGWNMLKPVTAMKVVGSKTFEKLFDNVRAAEDTWAVDVSEAKQFYDGASDKYGFKKWDFKKRYSFKDSAGSDFSLSLEQIMSLYAYSKREQADKHLEFGGFIFDDAIEITEKNKLGIPFKYEVNDANPYRLRKEDLLAITNSLTKEQKAFIDEMQTYLSDVMGAKGNEVSLAMYDIKLYNEKNYFPLKTSRYFREFDPEKSGTPKIKNSGFSKKTVPQAGNPIVLANFMDVWASHVNDMSMYHAFVLPLEDFMRVYNYSSTAGGYDSVQQYIKNAYGAQANQYIEKLMDDLNGGARVDSSADVINKGLSLFKKASVFASASVVVQQPSAIARALAYINPKYFVTSTPSAMNLAKHKTMWTEVKKYAPVAVIKEMGYFDTGVGRSTVEWLKGNQTIKDKMDDVLSKAPAMADELVWTHIWEAVKKETAAKHGFKVGSEDFLKECGRRFTEIITNTQVYDSVLSRSGMMRSKDTGMKMATAFMAEPTTTVNMMVDGMIQGKRGNKKFTAATVGAVSASIILNSILVALVYAARDDDEDETYSEKYVGRVTSELLDGFNPLTYVPFVKDVWSIAQGYDVERSDMSVVSKLWESVEGLFKEDKSGWEKVLDVTGSVSSLFGIPLKNLIRDAKGMYNLTKTLTSGTQTTGAGISESIEDAFKSSIPLWDRLTETENNADRLYDAIISGDQTQIERIKGRYKNEKAIESALRQALREHDPRILEAAQARYDGDISEYTRIAKEIIAEGNFSQDTVVGAINAEVSAIRKGESTREESTETKDEVTSIYSGSDINAAFDNGDTELALEIVDNLIETKVANGMEEKNAKSSVRSSMTSHWKPLYKQAYQSGDYTEMTRIRRILLTSGLYGSSNDVVKTVKNWLKD